MKIATSAMLLGASLLLSSPALAGQAGILSMKLENDVLSGGRDSHHTNGLETAWCFHSTHSFKEAVLAAANLGDDADTTAAITGQVAGAFYGKQGIPAAWLDTLYLAAEIEDTALALLQAAQAR